MAAPVETVGASERMDGLFQVGPDQPDLHPCLLVSERIGKRQKNRRTRCAVVCSDKSRFKESVIVSSENKNILVRIGAAVKFAVIVVPAIGAPRLVAIEVFASICAPSLCRI